MRRSLLLLPILSLVLILAACASEPATAPADEAAPAAPDAASADPVSGTWTGDWGPSETHRNNVTLELKLDGTTVTGNVNPGPDAVPVIMGAFAPDTGMIMMQADAKGQGGAAVHYTIEGKVEGNMMTGTWIHDKGKGDFKLTKG